MKKITLALCACAFALTGLLASCSNEAPATSVNYTDVGKYSHSHEYAVKGTITTTFFDSMNTDTDGVTPLQTGKESSTTTVVTTTYEDGGAVVTWSTNENYVSNCADFDIKGKLFGTKETKNTSKSYGVAQAWDKTVTKVVDDYTNHFYAIDDEYYIAEIDQNTGNMGKLIKLESYAVSEDDPAFDGEFGGEFTLTYTIVTDHATFEEWTHGDFNYEDDYTKNTSNGYSEYSDWKDAKEKFGYKNTETTEVKLTFYPIQDFDPEAEVEEDEE